MEHEIVQWVAERLSGRPVPDDLRRMAALQAAGAGSPLDRMEASLFEPGETHPSLDMSYLNDADRARPDIMANVVAIQEVLRHAGFDDDRFAQVAESFAAAGIPISAPRRDDLRESDIVVAPQILHEEVDQRERARLGLPSYEVLHQQAAEAYRRQRVERDLPPSP